MINMHQLNTIEEILLTVLQWIHWSKNKSELSYSKPDRSHSCSWHHHRDLHGSHSAYPCNLEITKTMCLYTNMTLQGTSGVTGSRSWGGHHWGHVSAWPKKYTVSYQTTTPCLPQTKTLHARLKFVARCIEKTDRQTYNQTDRLTDIWT